MIDTILFNLCKQQFFECGSLALQASQQRNHSSHLAIHKKSSFHHPHHHHHGVQGIHNAQVLCACYACEGFAIINLSQSNNFKDKKKRVCLYFHFSNSFVQEAAYALWLEDQRKAIHEKAALYLERFSDKCRACGGNGFIPGHGRGLSVNEQLKAGSGKRFSSMYSLFVICCSLASESVKQHDGVFNNNYFIVFNLPHKFCVFRYASQEK